MIGIVTFTHHYNLRGPEAVYVGLARMALRGALLEAGDERCRLPHAGFEHDILDNVVRAAVHTSLGLTETDLTVAVEREPRTRLPVRLLLSGGSEVLRRVADRQSPLLTGDTLLDAVEWWRDGHA